MVFNIYITNGPHKILWECNSFNDNYNKKCTKHLIIHTDFNWSTLFSNCFFFSPGNWIVQRKDSHQFIKKSKVIMHLNVHPRIVENTPRYSAQWFTLVNLMARIPTPFVLAQFERLAAPLLQNHLTFRLFFPSSISYCCQQGSERVAETRRKVLVILPGEQFQYPLIIHFEVAWTSVTTARACKRKCCGENWAFASTLLHFKALHPRLVLHPRGRRSINTSSRVWRDLPPELQRSVPIQKLFKFHRANYHPCAPRHLLNPWKK